MENCFLIYAIVVTPIPKRTKRSRERHPCILFPIPRVPCDSDVPSGAFAASDSRFLASRAALCFTEIASPSSITGSSLLHVPPVTFQRTPSAAPSLRGGCRPFPYPTCPSGWTFGLSGDCIRTRHAAAGLGQLQRLQPSLKGSRREILQGLGSGWVLRSDPPSIRFQDPLLVIHLASLLS